MANPVPAQEVAPPLHAPADDPVPADALLLADLRRLLPELHSQPGPLRPARDATGFHH